MDTKGWTKQLPPDARAVLDAGLGVSPPPGVKQAVWSALASQLPAAATVGTAAAGKSALALFKPLAVGLAIGVAAVGVVVGPSLVHTTPAHDAAPRGSLGGAAQHREPAAAEPVIVAPRSQPSAGSAVSAPTRAQPGASRESNEPHPATSNAGEPGAAGPARAEFAPSASATAYPADASAVATPENAVLLESRRVAHARSLLQQGNARAVLHELDNLDRSFPGGVLSQERDVLRIEALLALGNGAAAREAARRFLTRYPDSPHVAAVERALGGSE